MGGREVYFAIRHLPLLFSFSKEKKQSEVNLLASTANNVVEELLSEIVPVWKMDRNELVEYLSSQVIYSDGSFDLYGRFVMQFSDKMIAFNKPYGMAYSGGPSNRPQFDRLLQDVRAISF